MRNRIIKIWMILLILMSTLSPIYGTEKEHSTIFMIKEPEDLVKLSQLGSDASFTEDMNIYLLNDIDMTEYDFHGIPSLSGVFDGQNHSVTGVTIRDKGSVVGFFRYIEESGTVKDLKIEGTVEPGGSKESIGGIVGINKGIVSNVAFEGKVDGDYRIGGIAGLNKVTGKILSCSSSGAVYGEQMVGGIVGENNGVIDDSVNDAKVNTREHNRTISVNKLSIQQLNQSGVVSSVMDIGGVVGYSDGVILDSINRGEIGYQHIGYNIGGIAGRQTGFIQGCTNEGHVYGRKDVGGIVGQMEPDLKIRYREEHLKSIGDELDLLQEEMGIAFDDVDASNAMLNQRMNDLTDSVQQTRRRLNEVYDGLIMYGDDTTSEINEISRRTEKFINDLVPMIESTKLSAEAMTIGFGHMKNAFADLKNASSDSTDGLEDVIMGLEAMERAFDDLSDGIENLEEAVKLLSNAVTENESVEKAFTQIRSALVLLESAAEAIEVGSENLDDALDNILDEDKEEGQDEPSVSDHITLAVELLGLAFENIEEEYQRDTKLVEGALEYTELALLDFSDSAEELNSSIGHIRDGAEHFKDTSEDIEGAMLDFELAMESFESAGQHMSDTTEMLEMAVRYQQEQRSLKIPTLGEYIAEPGDGLFLSLEKVEGDFRELNDAVNASTTLLTEDMRKMNNRIFGIIDLVRKGVASRDSKWQDLYEDISENDLPTDIGLIEPMNGYIIHSLNLGSISADINVGGIVGAMEIEVQVDPESDYGWLNELELATSLNGKAVLAYVQNEGLVVGKKDYVGGILGYGELGIVIHSENYSEVKSETGSYVGGIAGYSDASIRNSYAMSKISGMDYLGGIAGYGHTIEDTGNMTRIVFEDNEHEKIGAVAGGRDDESGDFNRNYFVSKTLRGIDSISYGNEAEQVDYDELVNLATVPDRFKNLEISFYIENNKVYTHGFSFGSVIEADDLPLIPKKEGYFGQWPEYDYDELTFSDRIDVEYIPLVQVLSSENELNEPSEVLVEGIFSPYGTLNVKNIDVDFPYESLKEVLKTNRIGRRLQLEVSDIEDYGIEIYTYRIKTEEQKNRQFYLMDGENWQPLEIEYDGTYITFQHFSKSLVVTEIISEMNWQKLMLVIIAIITVGIIVLINLKKKSKGMMVYENNLEHSYPTEIYYK